MNLDFLTKLKFLRHFSLNLYGPIIFFSEYSKINFISIGGERDSNWANLSKYIDLSLRNKIQTKKIRIKFLEQNLTFKDIFLEIP